MPARGAKIIFRLCLHCHSFIVGQATMHIIGAGCRFTSSDARSGKLRLARINKLWRTKKN